MGDPAFTRVHPVFLLTFFCLTVKNVLVLYSSVLQNPFEQRLSLFRMAQLLPLKISNDQLALQIG